MYRSKLQQNINSIWRPRPTWMNALQGSLMKFQRCSATVKKSLCIIRKKTNLNLLQRNAEMMTLSQSTDRLVSSKDLRERTLLINAIGVPIMH